MTSPGLPSPYGDRFARDLEKVRAVLRGGAPLTRTRSAQVVSFVLASGALYHAADVPLPPFLAAALDALEQAVKRAADLVVGRAPVAEPLPAIGDRPGMQARLDAVVAEVRGAHDPEADPDRPVSAEEETGPGYARTLADLAGIDLAAVAPDVAEDAATLEAAALANRARRRLAGLGVADRAQGAQGRG